MKPDARVKLFMMLQVAAIMMLMLAEAVHAANAISLPAAEPYTMYYTTNGATPTVPTSGTSTTSPSAPPNYTNFYVAEGTKITRPTVVPDSETFALVPDAGKRGHYARPPKLKAHESKREFEKYVKEKHGKRYKVDSFSVRQSESGLTGHIFIIENKNPDILQLGRICTAEERAKRIAVAKEFILNNPELIGLTENEELRERGRERSHCGDLYFDRYINEYKLQFSPYHFTFAPQWNFSVSVDTDLITPEMYAAAQADALPSEEIAQIVYRDLKIPLDEKNGKKPPRLEMRKYLRNKPPYVYWRIAYDNVYDIDAITGEILYKKPNIRR